MSFLDTVHQVIDLAGQMDRYYEQEMPKYHPNYPFSKPMDDDPPPPKAEIELEELLESLPSDAIYRLMTLMYLGRGDVSADDMAGACEHLKQTFATTKLATKQMVGKPLAEYLSDGLAEAEAKGIHLESGSFAHAQSSR